MLCDDTNKGSPTEEEKEGTFVHNGTWPSSESRTGAVSNVICDVIGTVEHTVGVVSTGLVDVTGTGFTSELRSTEVNVIGSCDNTDEACTEVSEIGAGGNDVLPTRLKSGTSESTFPGACTTLIVS